MHVRIVSFTEGSDDFNLIGYADDIQNISELIKSLDYMKKHEIPITINTRDVVDTGGEEYYIEDFSIIFPSVDGETGTHLTIYVEDKIFKEEIRNEWTRNNTDTRLLWRWKYYI